jgi:hypothetical protein
MSKKTPKAGKPPASKKPAPKADEKKKPAMQGKMTKGLEKIHPCR